MELFHSTNKANFTLHIGQCYTDWDEAAMRYTDGEGLLALVEIDLDELNVVEVEGYDRDENEAPGDHGTDFGDIDVIVYEDEDPHGREHTTWRIVSARALAAIKIIDVE